MEKTARGKKSKYFISGSEYNTFNFAGINACNSHRQVFFLRENLRPVGKIRVKTEKPYKNLKIFVRNALPSPS
jgi:hypothetical protein